MEKSKKYLVSIPKDMHKVFKRYCVESEISLNTLFITGAENAVNKTKVKEVSHHGR